MAVPEIAVRYRWLALTLAFAGQVSNGFSAQAVAPLAPLFQPELGLSNSDVGVFSSAAYAGAWGILAVAGLLTDRFGARTMMSGGQIVSGFFMLAMALAGNFYQALAVMFAVGAGRALAAPSLSKTIMDFFPPDTRATAMGVRQAAVPLAGILAASVLPAVALVSGWRMALALAGTGIIASGVASAILYPASRTQEEAAQEKARLSDSLRVVLRNRGLWSMSLISLLFAAVQAAATTYLALYLAGVVLRTTIPEDGPRVIAAGGYLALCQAGGVFGRVFWGMASDRLFHGRRLPVLGLIGVLAGGSSLAAAYLGDASSPLVLPLVALGLGVSALAYNGLYHTAIVETAGSRYAGSAVGVSMTLTQVGTVGGPPLFGFIVDQAGSYQPGWLFLAAISIASAAAALMAGRGERRVQSPHA